MQVLHWIVGGFFDDFGRPGGGTALQPYAYIGAQCTGHFVQHVAGAAEQAAVVPNLIADMNSQDLAFTANDGDLR